MRYKSVFLTVCLLSVTLIAPAQIGRRGVHVIGSTNASYIGGIAGVTVVGGSGSSSVPANALLHDNTGAALLNDATGAYLLNDNP
jgi:outer membrane lipoprotein SlyB